MVASSPAALVRALRPRILHTRALTSAKFYPIQRGLASTRHQLRLNSTSPATSEKREPARNSAYIDKNDTIDLELHDINQAIGDAHQMLHTIFPSKGKYYPETPTARPLQSPKVDPLITVDDNVVSVSGVEFPNIWLRDNCQCSSCVHDATRQRLIDIFEIPEDISIKTSETDAGGVKVEWSDGHKSYYQNRFLHNAIGTFRERAIVRQGLRSPSLWGSEISKNPPTVSYEDVMQDHSNGLYFLLSKIRNHGFCFISSVPHTTSSATEALLTRIAFIRHTHYGAFYDFTADLSSKDMAYTSVALPAHTDNTYFSDPAGLQAFHLLSHTDGSGGASLLVDGFKAARDLFEEDGDAYRVLSSVNVHAHASGNEGISIQPYRGFPVLSHDPATGLLSQVRWNTADRAAIELPVSETPLWYSAARKFDGILKRKENEYWEQLTPGRVLVFDNWRVLHGRSAFTGKRRICGAYVNRDDWVSRYKMAVWGQEEVLGHLTAG